MAIQWLWNVAQALARPAGLGPSREVCCALSCSYCTRVAIRCLMALSSFFSRFLI